MRNHTQKNIFHFLWLIDILSFTPSEKVFDSHVFVMDKVTGIFLRKEVKELREKGASWGLSKEQIDEAILRALGGKHINFKSFLFFFILMKAEYIHILSIFWTLLIDFMLNLRVFLFLLSILTDIQAYFDFRGWRINISI